MSSRRLCRCFLLSAFLALASPLFAQTLPPSREALRPTAVALAEAGQIASPDGRRQMNAIAATSPITIDGVLDEDVWRQAVAGNRIHPGRSARRTSRQPKTPKCASPSTPTTSTSGRFVATPPRRHRRQRNPQGLCRPRPGHVRGPARHVCRSAERVRLHDQLREARRPTRRWPTKAATSTPTGTPSGGLPPGRAPDGWTAEFRIPFKTLRFAGGDAHTWGINFARRVRRKTEVSYWSPVSRAYSIYRASSDGDLAGLPLAPARPQPARQAVRAGRRGAWSRRSRPSIPTPAPGWTSRPA